MSAPTELFPARVAANLGHAWGGVWRLTYRRFLAPAHWITLGIGLAVLALLFAGGPHGGNADGFLDWTISFYITFLVPVLAFMSSAGAMRDGMKSGTVDYVLTRPVPRPAFVAFKYVAHVICTKVDFLFVFALVATFAVIRKVPDLATVATQLLFCQLLLVAAFSGLGMLCGVITSRYVVIGLVYAGLIEAGVGQIPTQISRLSLTHQVRDLLRPLWDHATTITVVPGWFGVVATMVAFCVVMLGAAAAIFTMRELSGPSDV
jgi:ABC-type transport system involved in multi-copper enzyme maturation permease subunit